MKQHEVSAKKPRKRFSLSNVNGLFIVAAVLAATIMLAGNTQARLQQTAAELNQIQAAAKVAHCPFGKQYSAPTVVR
ncbi:MAG: hypothetical protein ACR2OV_09475 [Hyphomicrobiaceae bacterium]